MSAEGLVDRAVPRVTGARRSSQRWSRRALLLGASPLLLACDSVESLVRQAARIGPRPTPASSELRRVRVARAGLAELSFTGALSAVAGARARERGVRYDVEAWPLTEKDGGGGWVPVLDPERWPDVFAGLVASALPSDSPDLVLTSSTTVSALGRVGALHDLGLLLGDEGWYRADHFVDGVLRTGEVRNRLLALPLTVGVELLLYSAPILQEIGAPPPKPNWTWADLVRLARATRRAGEGDMAGRWGMLVTPLAPTLFSIAWQQGSQLVSSDGSRLVLTEAGTIHTIEFLVDLIRTEVVAPPIGEGGLQPVLTTWAPRRFALAPTFSTGTVWWHTQVYDGTEICELPDQRRGLMATAPILVGIPRAAPDLKHSLNALRGLVEAAGTTMVLPARKTTPPLRQVNSSLNENDAAVLASAAKVARFLPGDLPWTQLAPLVSREVMLPALSGRKSARQAAHDAQPLIDRRLAELRSAR